jgi:hypothetical protein
MDFYFLNLHITYPAQGKNPHIRKFFSFMFIFKDYFHAGLYFSEMLVPCYAETPARSLMLHALRKSDKSGKSCHKAQCLEHRAQSEE